MASSKVAASPGNDPGFQIGAHLVVLGIFFSPPQVGGRFDIPPGPPGSQGALEMDLQPTLFPHRTFNAGCEDNNEGCRRPHPERDVLYEDTEQQCLLKAG